MGYTCTSPFGQKEYDTFARDDAEAVLNEIAVRGAAKRAEVQAVIDSGSRGSGKRSSDTDITMFGQTLRCDSLRYEVFRHSPVCVCCGRVGKVMLLQRRKAHRESAWRCHFNLYDDEGVMMTKDHVVPKSKGGPNTLDNLQTMCEPCNQAKGSGD